MVPNTKEITSKAESKAKELSTSATGPNTLVLFNVNKRQG
jgi:hypothetical protein